MYNVLYTGLNIPVTENTRLVYNITPQQPLPNNKYDYDFYSMHLAVDLKFTDGTYLSSTELEDENGERQIVRVSDRMLYDRHLDEGSLVTFDEKHQLTAWFAK